MTGAGGGALRDVFAGRKPMIFHSEIYGFWAALAGLFIGLDQRALCSLDIIHRHSNVKNGFVPLQLASSSLFFCSEEDQNRLISLAVESKSVITIKHVRFRLFGPE